MPIIYDDQTIFRPTIDTTGDIWDFPQALRRIQVSNTGSNELRLYRRQVDFTNDANYIDLAASIGFFDGPIVNRRFWLRAHSGSTTAVVSVYYADGITTG